MNIQTITCIAMAFQWIFLMNIELVEMSTNLDSLFHKVVNTMSTPLGVEGGE